MHKPYDVFVSYSRHDQDRVRPWVTRLCDGGVEAFFDTESLVGGSEWREAIVDAINECKVVIFVASETAFASDYVPKELALAEQAKKFILPIFLDKTQPTKKAAFILADLHRINADGKSDEEIWAAIVRALEARDVFWKVPEPEKEEIDINPADSDPVSQRRRKRDDSWLEWDASNPKIEVEEEGEADESRNERRRPVVEVAEAESAAEVVSDLYLPTIEASGKPEVPEVEGRCLLETILSPAMNPADESNDSDGDMAESTEGHLAAEESRRLTEPAFKARVFWLVGSGLCVIAASFLFVRGPSHHEDRVVPSQPVIDRKGREIVPTPPPIANKVQPASLQSVAQPVPLKPKTLTEVAIELVTKYYAAPSQGDGLAQLAFMSDPMADYFDSKSCPLEKVRADLISYASMWPTQQFKIVGPIQAVEKDSNGSFECEADIAFSSENDVARQSGTFRGQVTVDVLAGTPKIVAVNQVPGSRKSDPPTFKKAGQEKRAVEFVRAVVESGSSASGISAEQIAASFVQTPNYYGKPVTHEEIVTQTRRLAERWTNRTYTILGEPQVTEGLETNHVTVVVKMKFEAIRDGESKPSSSGMVTARYALQFSMGGTPLIASVEEIERLPASKNK